MFRLSEILPHPAVPERDAGIDRTGFAGAAGGRLLAFAASRRWLAPALANAAVAALVVTPELAAEVPAHLGLIVDPDPEIAFYRLHNRLVAEFGMRRPLPVPAGIDPTARVHPAAIVDPFSAIGPEAVVEAGAIVHPGTVIGARTRIAAGAQVGCEGFFGKRRPGLLVQALHAGGCEIGPDCVVLPGATVQRGVHFEATRLDARVALGPQVNIGHGCEIGADTAIAGGCDVSGYVRIGSGVWIGPGSVISNLIGIGDNARIEIGSVVARSVPAGERQSGLFAGPHRRMLRIGAALTRDHG